jgi:hypothetical protein
MVRDRRGSISQEDLEHQNATLWNIEDPSRPRGILNERARKYLLDPSLIEPNSEYQQEIKEEIESSDIEPKTASEREVRQNIRNWTMNTIFDFAILVGHLEERDKRKILNDGWDPKRAQETGENPPVYNVRYDLPFVITFIYQMYQIDSGTVAAKGLAETVRKGIESAHATAGEHATANVNIEVSVGPDIDELSSRFEEQGPNGVTEEEAYLLYQHDQITRDEYIDVLKAVDS